MIPNSEISPLLKVITLKHELMPKHVLLPKLPSFFQNSIQNT